MIQGKFLDYDEIYKNLETYFWYPLKLKKKKILTAQNIEKNTELIKEFTSVPK